MGLALKQWSVYLGNVLLNFIHKECKNGNVCSANREQHINNFMNQQIKQQHIMFLFQTCVFKFVFDYLFQTFCQTQKIKQKQKQQTI